MSNDNKDSLLNISNSMADQSKLIPVQENSVLDDFDLFPGLKDILAENTFQPSNEGGMVSQPSKPLVQNHSEGNFSYILN